MTNVEAAIEIAAPVEKVWRFVTAPENFAKYIPGYHAGEIISQPSDSDGRGMTFRWYTKFLGVRLATTETVVQATENQIIRYEGRSTGVFFRSQMQTQPFQSGTRFSAQIAYAVPWWLLGGVLDRLLIRPRVRAEIRASLENVKRILESTSPS